MQKQGNSTTLTLAAKLEKEYLWFSYQEWCICRRKQFFDIIKFDTVPVSANKRVIPSFICKIQFVYSTYNIAEMTR